MISVIKHFNELSTHELYAIIQLRMEVFVMEQNCHYMDCDEKDYEAYHLMYWDNDKLIAYCRLLPEGVSYKNYTSIGRVATRQTHRAKLLGKKLMEDAIAFLESKYPESIKISAQSYLERFYSNLGFAVTGEEYMEDDIPHKGMIRKR